MRAPASVSCLKCGDHGVQLKSPITTSSLEMFCE